MRRVLGALLIVAGLCWTLPVHAAVELEASVSRSTLSVGESTTLDIIVRGATGGIGQPQFDTPPGLEILGSSRRQSFTWDSGRSTSETVFRYDLAPSVAGTFEVGPVRVRVGQQTFEAPVVVLSVGAAPTRIGPPGAGPAELRVDVEPARPYLGEPVLLRVRLVQRASLAEDPRYAPPSTPGFWSEEASPPKSYYADEGGNRVLVTETRTRMYAIAVGATTIGEATAAVTLAAPGAANDPLQWLRGIPRRQVTLRSRPIGVDVRALPEPPPATFGGAVGTLSATWSVDRRETRVDVPVTVRLDLRGAGNLPLAQAPALDSDVFEFFASTVEDSMPVAGQLSAGRRRFIWTALPLKEGRLRLAAPAFAWFDPARRTYVGLEAPDIVVDVGPVLPGGANTETRLPRELGDRDLDPFRRPAAPWAFAVAGLALGMAVWLWRRAAVPEADAMERARQREWLRLVGLAHGPEFWRAGEQATAWAMERGADVGHLRREIASARYGGTLANAESIRRRVIELLGAALPAATPRWPARLAAGLLAAAAVAMCVLAGPKAGGTEGFVRARTADQAAAEQRVEEARGGWIMLWREGARAPGLAARIAWSHVSAGEVGAAALWVLRGESTNGRDRGLAWVREQVREGGGLSGDNPTHLPVRPVEWAVLALIAGAVAGLNFGRRPRAAVWLLLAIGLAMVRPVESWWQKRSPHGVMREATQLTGPNVELGAGHVVRVHGTSEGLVRVSAGHGVHGTVPAGRIDLTEDAP